MVTVLVRLLDAFSCSLLEFLRLHYCSFIKVLFAVVRDSFVILTQLFCFVNNFFENFSFHNIFGISYLTSVPSMLPELFSFLSVVSRDSFAILTCCPYFVNHFF